MQDTQPLVESSDLEALGLVRNTHNERRWLWLALVSFISVAIGAFALFAVHAPWVTMSPPDMMIAAESQDADLRTLQMRVGKAAGEALFKELIAQGKSVAEANAEAAKKAACISEHLCKTCQAKTSSEITDADIEQVAAATYIDNCMSIKGAKIEECSKQAESVVQDINNENGVTNAPVKEMIAMIAGQKAGDDAVKRGDSAAAATQQAGESSKKASDALGLTKDTKDKVIAETLADTAVKVTPGDGDTKPNKVMSVVSKLADDLGVDKEKAATAGIVALGKAAGEKAINENKAASAVAKDAADAMGKAKEASPVGANAAELADVVGQVVAKAVARTPGTDDDKSEEAAAATKEGAAAIGANVDDAVAKAAEKIAMQAKEKSEGEGKSQDQSVEDALEAGNKLVDKAQLSPELSAKAKGKLAGELCILPNRRLESGSSAIRGCAEAAAKVAAKSTDVPKDKIGDVITGVVGAVVAEKVAEIGESPGTAETIASDVAQEVSKAAGATAQEAKADSVIASGEVDKKMAIANQKTPAEVTDAAASGAKDKAVELGLVNDDRVLEKVIGDAAADVAIGQEAGKLAKETADAVGVDPKPAVQKVAKEEVLELLANGKITGEPEEQVAKDVGKATAEVAAGAQETPEQQQKLAAESIAEVMQEQERPDEQETGRIAVGNNVPERVEDALIGAGMDPSEAQVKAVSAVADAVATDVEKGLEPAVSLKAEDATVQEAVGKAVAEAADALNLRKEAEDKVKIMEAADAGAEVAKNHGKSPLVQETAAKKKAVDAAAGTDSIPHATDALIAQAIGDATSEAAAEDASPVEAAKAACVMAVKNRGVALPVEVCASAIARSAKETAKNVGSSPEQIAAEAALGSCSVGKGPAPAVKPAPTAAAR